MLLKRSQSSTSSGTFIPTSLSKQRLHDLCRRERVTGVKTTSHELGKILEFSDGTIDGDKEALQKNLRERYSWMWEWNGADAQEGLQILEKRLN